MHNEQNEKLKCHFNNEILALIIDFKTCISYDNVAIDHDIKCIDDI